MPIFPVRRYEFQVPAQPAEIAALLRGQVQPLPVLTRRAGHKAFAGSVSETGFRFLRVGEYRNSFRPTISGVLHAAAQGTSIRVTIQHDGYFFCALAVIVGLLALFALQDSGIPLLRAVMANNLQEIDQYTSSAHLFILCAPLAALLLGYVSLWLFFDPEAAAAKRELAEILAGEIRGPGSTPRA